MTPELKAAVDHLLADGRIQCSAALLADVHRIKSHLASQLDSTESNQRRRDAETLRWLEVEYNIPVLELAIAIERGDITVPHVEGK